MDIVRMISANAGSAPTPMSCCRADEHDALDRPAREGRLHCLVDRRRKRRALDSGGEDETKHALLLLQDNDPSSTVSAVSRKARVVEGRPAWWLTVGMPRPSDSLPPVVARATVCQLR